MRYEYFENCLHAIDSVVVVAVPYCFVENDSEGREGLFRAWGGDREESTTKPGMPNATFMQQILT